MRKRHLQQELFHATGTPTRRNGKPTRGGKRKGAGRPPKGKRAGAAHKKRPTLKSWQPVHVVLRVVDVFRNLRKRHMYKAVREASISVASRELDYQRFLPDSAATGSAATDPVATTTARAIGTALERATDARGRLQRATDARGGLVRPTDARGRRYVGAFRIVHISIQRNHIHLLVEADNKLALSRGMQGFQISAAKHLNRAFSIASVRVGTRTTGWHERAMTNRRRGTVFPDRFHQEIITTPRQARRALAYVLNNWRKHREDQGELERTWNVDPFSTGVLFAGWKEREEAEVYWRWRETYDPLVVYLPKTWLLREGWRRHGLVRFDEVPSTRPVPARAPA